MKRRASIDHRLPVLASGLLTATVVAMAALAYHELGSFAVGTAGVRLSERSKSWADLFALDVPQRLEQLGRAAQSSSVQGAILSSDSASYSQALGELQRLAVSSTVAFELRDAEGVSRLSTAPDSSPPVSSPPPSHAEFGPLRTDESRSVFYDICFPVTIGDEAVGTLVEHRRIAADEQGRRALDGLLDEGTELLLGNATGDLWTDLSEIVPGPPSDWLARTGREAIEYERGGARRLGAMALVTGTPWMVVVEIPRAVVYQPVRRSLLHLVWIAAGLIVLGAGSAWLLSRQLTAPLRDLTDAVGAITHGNVNRRVHLAREDELGRLAEAFNVMADRVADARHDLEAKVEDRTRELRDANAELAQREKERTILYERLSKLDQVKTQFFANVSHELRTPLTLILSPVRKLLASQGLSDVQRKDLELVRRSASILLEHVDDLLDIAKLEAGRMEASYSEIDLASWIRVIASNFDSFAEERGIAYRLEAPENLVAQVDPEKVRRILLNLLSNALKFTPSGGTVSCHLDAPDGRTAVLAVRDDGPGIPSESRERIFERFYQVEGGATQTHGGTGLGLAIAKEFAELHRGSIRVEEVPGGGALFTVELPLEAPPGVPIRRGDVLHDEAIRARAVLESRGEQAERSRAHVELQADAPLVLLVEDNREMNAFLFEALSGEFRVVSAFDGLQGLEKAVELHPDLIVCDMMMPRMSGEQLIAAIRSREDLENTPILVLTAKADDELRARLIRTGAQDCLGKPFLTEEVLARASGLVDRHRRARAATEEMSRMLRAVTEGLTDAVFVKDHRGRYLMLNGAAARLLGHTVEGALGKADSDLLPLDAAGASAALEEEITQQGQSRTYEEDLAPLGVRRTLLTTKAPYRDEYGRTIGIVGVSRDISERKQAEEALRETNSALLYANEDLEHLVHAANHDMQEPLRMISIYGDLLRKKSIGGQDPEVDEILNVMIEGARRMRFLLDGILEYSRLGSANEPEVPLDTASVLQQSLLNLDASIRQSQAVVTFDPLPELRMQEIHLLQLFQNLVSNAIKFHGPEPPRVHVSSGTRGGKRLIAIRDNGVGIEERYAHRVFELFKRLHGREYQGAGIGLAICKRIAERYGGKIWVESEPGKGSTFYFTVPEE